MAAASAAAVGQGVDPLNFITFRIEEKRPRATLRAPDEPLISRPKELPIDASLEVKWQTREFLSAVSRLRNPSVPLVTSAPDTSSIELALAGLDLLLEGQQRQLDVETSKLKLETQPPTSPLVGSIRKQSEEAKLKMQQFTSDAKSRLASYEQTNVAAVRRYSAATAKAASGDLSALREAVQQSLEEVGSDLDRKLANAPRLEVFMEANLVGANGKRVPVHLEGYDKVETGERVKFPRNRMAIDARTMQEIAAAQQIIDLSNNLANKLPQQIEGAKQRLDESLKALSSRLSVEETMTRLKNLIGQMSRVPGNEAQKILAEAMELNSLLQPIANSKLLTARSEQQGLLALATKFQSFSIHLNANLLKLPDTVGRLARDLAQMAVNSPELIDADTIAFFQGKREEYAADQDYLQQIGNASLKIADILGVTTDIQQMTAELLPRQVDPANLADLDTKLDLETVKSGRHPGDKIVIDVVVREAGQTSVVGQSTHTFYVEAYGAYLQARGGLLFVDPRGSGGRNINFDPVVGLGYFYHYGVKGSSFWNRTLNPGIGVAFSMLDFDDNRRFELGAAATLTLFNDLLWVGYGRNFQARTDYFYLGINPTSLGGLLRRKP